MKKDATGLSQRPLRITLHIYQCSIRILYKTCPQLFIADWPSRHNHKRNRDKEILGMNITINAIESFMDIPNWLTEKEIRSVTLEDKHLNMVSDYILYRWPSIRAEIQKCLETNWLFRDEIVIISGTAKKVK